MTDVSLEIPRRLNDPPRMFWWDLDVSLLVLAAALAGMISGFFVSGCAVGILLASAYGRAKAGKLSTVTLQFRLTVYFLWQERLEFLPSDIPSD